MIRAMTVATLALAVATVGAAVPPTPTGPAPAASPSPMPVHPGDVLRRKYGLLAQTWKSILPRIIEDDPEQIREHLRQVFYSYVVNPKQVTVEIVPTTREQLLAGVFPRVQFEFHDGQFDTGTVRHLVADMHDVTLNYEDLLLNDRIRFDHEGKIDYLCEVDEAEFNRAIFDADRKMNVRNPHIELRDGSLRFTGKVKHGLGTTSVRVDGCMKVVDHTKIFFQPSSLKLGILPMPGFIAREIFSRLNPIADLSKLKMNATPDLIVSRPARLFVLTRGMENLVGKD